MAPESSIQSLSLSGEIYGPSQPHKSTRCSGIRTITVERVAHLKMHHSNVHPPTEQREDSRDYESAYHQLLPHKDLEGWASFCTIWPSASLH